MEDLRQDPGYSRIKALDSPSEKVCRDLLKFLPDITKDELRYLNKKILEIQAKNEQLREVMIDKTNAHKWQRIPMTSTISPLHDSNSKTYKLIEEMLNSYR